MTPEQLQALWQQQVLDARVARPDVSPVPMADLAAPTSQFSPRPASRMRVVALAAAAAVVVGLGGWLLARVPTQPPAPVPVASTAEHVEELIAECRTFASTEGSPDLARARAACAGALALEPSSLAAAGLLKRITVLEGCETSLVQARSRLSAGQLDLALDLLATVGGACETYLIEAQALARAAGPDGLARAEAACRQELSSNDPKRGACSRYAAFACQQHALDGDGLFSAFSKSPLAKGWSCPQWPAFRTAPVEAPREVRLKDALARRFTDARMRSALEAYAGGETGRALASLREVLSDPGAKALHGEARGLSEDITAANELLGLVAAALERGDLVAGVAQLKALFARDERILGVEGVSSLPARRAGEVLATRAYKVGSDSADQKNSLDACRAWKLGLSASRSNLDLLKAVTNVCSVKAADLFSRAHTCDDLRGVLEFAVDGDGYRERAEARMKEERCR